LIKQHLQIDVFMRLAYNLVYSCSRVVVRLYASDEFLYTTRRFTNTIVSIGILSDSLLRRLLYQQLHD
jgi:hypothetical protein